MTDKSLTRRYRLITAFFISLASIAPAFTSDNSLTILLTNDDGYLSPGIRAMRQALLDQGHEVFMVAPAENQSGSSASISPDGITVTDHGLNVWSVEGRPADAVRFGLGQLMADQPPDLVISGINFGQNVGADVMISGTVGAATTAVRLGIPAIAISASIDFKEAGEAFPSTLKAMPKAAAFLAKQLRDLPLEDKAMLINVNYPSIDRPKGVLTTSLSPTSIIGRGYTQTASGEWRANYALAGDALSSEATSNEDRAALQAGFITVSPLRASYAAVEPSPFVLQALEALGE